MKIVFIFSSLFSAGFASAEEDHLQALNADQLEILSNGSFELSVDDRGILLIKGNWPQSCEDSAKITAYHSTDRLNLRTYVSEKCASLLDLKRNQLKRIPRVPMKALDIHEPVYNGESIYLESKSPTLNLELPVDQWMESHSEDTSPINVEGTASDSILRIKPEKTIDGSIKYRMCNPRAFGSTDPSLCYGRYLWDASADISLGSNTKLRGSTQLDLKIPDGLTNGLTENLTGKAGIHIDLLYQFGN